MSLHSSLQAPSASLDTAPAEAWQEQTTWLMGPGLDYTGLGLGMAQNFRTLAFGPDEDKAGFFTTMDRDETLGTWGNLLFPPNLITGPHPCLWVPKNVLRPDSFSPATSRSNHFAPWYLHKGIENLCPYQNLHTMFVTVLFITANRGSNQDILG